VGATIRPEAPEHRLRRPVLEGERPVRIRFAISQGLDRCLLIKLVLPPEDELRAEFDRKRNRLAKQPEPDESH